MSPRAHALVGLDRYREDRAWITRNVIEDHRTWGRCRCGRTYQGRTLQVVRDLHRDHLNELRNGRSE